MLCVVGCVLWLCFVLYTSVIVGVCDVCACLSLTVTAQGKTLLLGLYEAHEAIMRGARKEDVELQNVGTTTFLGGLCVELSSEEVR